MRPSDQLLAIADQCLPTGPARKAQLIAEAEERASLAAMALRLSVPSDLTFSEEFWQELRESLAERLLWIRRFGLGPAWFEREVGLWTQAQREMLDRLADDRSRIESTFGRPADRVLAIHTELSHRHHHGRSVTVLDFASGLRLVYKPRSVAMEAWYRGLLEQLQAAQPPVEFCAPRVLCGEDYGWVEWIAHRACESWEEQRRFYRNAGGLLCLLHVSRATDMGYDNLVASGPVPVIVDAETLLQPALRVEPGSILQTGLLPLPLPAETDFSALGFVRDREITFPVDTHCGSAILHLRPAANLPRRNGAELSPDIYAEEQAEGFRLAWNWIAENRGILREVFKQARELETRYVVRDTQVYYHALVRALFEGDPALVRLSQFSGEAAPFHALLAEERNALARLDMPRFTAIAGSRSLAFTDDIFALSGYEAATATVESMSEAACAAQVQQLNSAWQTYSAARQQVCALKG